MTFSSPSAALRELDVQRHIGKSWRRFWLWVGIDRHCSGLRRQCLPCGQRGRRSLSVHNFMASHCWQLSGLYVRQGSPNSFVTKVSLTAGSILYYAVVLTGSITAMTVDANREVILAGSYPVNLLVTPDAFSSTVSTNFLIKVSSDAIALPMRVTSAVHHRTCCPPSIALHWTRQAISGSQDQRENSPRSSPSLIRCNPFQERIRFRRLGFISEFDSTFIVLFSTYFNGVQGGFTINSIALDRQGRAHVAGGGQSDLPVSPSAFLPSVKSLPSTSLNNRYGFAAMIDRICQGRASASRISSATVQVGASGQARLPSIAAVTLPHHLRRSKLAFSDGQRGRA